MARKAKATGPADPLEAVKIHIERGQFAPAIATLLPALERRAEEGDRECMLAAAVLRHSPMAEAAQPRPPDALAAALDRLVRLAQQQEQQIRALRGLIEEAL